FTQNDVDAPDDRHHICYQVPDRHLTQSLKIDKARRTATQPVRPCCSVAHEIHSELALGALNGLVNLTKRRFDNLRHLRHYRSFRHAFQRLFDDPVRLAHLLHSYKIAIVSIAMLAYRDLEVEILVRRIGKSAPEIPFHTGAAKKRSGQANVFRVMLVDYSDA